MARSGFCVGLLLMVAISCAPRRGRGGDDEGEATDDGESDGLDGPREGEGDGGARHDAEAPVDDDAGVEPGLGPACEDVFADGPCVACAERECCADLAACAGSDRCLDCASGDPDPDCAADPDLADFFACLDEACSAACAEERDDGGEPGGIDRDACTGTARDVSPNDATHAVAYNDDGWIALLLTPRPFDDREAGDVCTLVELLPVDGELDYSPQSGLVRCAHIEWDGAGWVPLEQFALCEAHLAVLELASDAGVCDGLIEGVYLGLLSGNETGSGSFVAPLPVAAGEIAELGCRPTDAPCADHDDCCSQSCSMFIGVCN